MTGKLIGYDITEDANSPMAVCPTCHRRKSFSGGEPLYEGEEWGCDSGVLRCEGCGIVLPVCCVPTRG